MSHLPPPLPNARSGNPIARNWRGEYPLAVSFWLCGLLGNVALWLLRLGLNRAYGLDDGYDPTVVFAVVTLIWLATPIVFIWQVTGVWRSAGRSLRQNFAAGRVTVWPYLARVAVVVGIVMFGLNVARLAVPQVEEATKIAFLGDPDLPPYGLRLMRGGTEMEISGGIKYGLHRDVLAMIEASPDLRTIHLDSLGGRVGEAKKLYETIRERGLSTYVANVCISACTIVLVAGRERWAHADAVIGFHAPTFPGLSAEDAVRSRDDQIRLLVAQGVDRAFADRALATPNADIWAPTMAELARARVITGVADPARFAVSGLGPDPTPERVAALLRDNNPVFAVLDDADPAAARSMAEALLGTYLDGVSAPEWFADISRALLAAVSRYRPHADDATIVALGRLIVDQYRALGAADWRLCYEYASGLTTITDFSPYLPADLVERELAVTRRIFGTADFARVVDLGDVDRLVAESGLAARLGAVAPADPAIARDAAGYRAYCERIIARFEAILALGDAQSAVVLRAVLDAM